jgi:predicted Fe-Mo cluster-binding NifX family protein
MSFRVAVASSDGKMVNEHFGRANQFLIFEAGDDGYEFLELRQNHPACGGDPDHQGSMDALVASISDCAFVLVNRIGRGGEESLARQGIKAFQIGDFIDTALQKLISAHRMKII